MINRVILQGRLTDHPELKHTPNGKAVTDFYIAVESGKKKNGERIVDFFRIKAWASAAEFICKYFEKVSRSLLTANCIQKVAQTEIRINAEMSLSLLTT